MFLKLWKYEIKCSYRNYLFTYAVLLLAALMFNQSNEVLMALISILFTVMIFATVIMTFVMVIRSYQNSMFSRAGYLTQTLPVSSKKILLVKILNSSLWFILSYMVIMAAVLMLVWRTGEINFGEIFQALGYAISEMTFDGWMMILAMLISVIETVTMIYMIMNLTHTNYIRSHRGIIAVVLFFGINLLISFINGLVFPNSSLDMGFAFSMGMADTSNAALSAVDTAFYISMIEGVILTGVYFFAAAYLLDHKLEIE